MKHGEITPEALAEAIAHVTGKDYIDETDCEEILSRLTPPPPPHPTFRVADRVSWYRDGVRHDAFITGFGTGKKRNIVIRWWHPQEYECSKVRRIALVSPAKLVKR